MQLLRLSTHTSRLLKFLRLFEEGTIVGACAGVWAHPMGIMRVLRTARECVRVGTAQGSSDIIGNQSTSTAGAIREDRVG
jgi:hypothetical protein